MVENLLEKIKETYPDNYSEINSIIKSNNYHLLLNVSIKDDSKINIIRRLHSLNYVNIFKTKKAREQLVQILTKIKNYISTPYAKELIFKLFPTTNKDEILKRQEFSLKSKELYDSIKDNVDYVKSLINSVSKVSYSCDKRHNGVVIAFADDSLYNDMKSVLSKKFYVTFIDSEHDLLSIDHYEQIRFIPGKDDSFNQLVEQIPQATTFIGSPSLEEVAPELITDLIEENKDVIDSLYAIDSFVPLSSLPPKPNSQDSNKISFTKIESQLVSLAKELESLIQSEISKANFLGSTLMGVISDKKCLIDLLDSSSKEYIRIKKQKILSSASDILGLSTSALFNIDYVGNVSLDESQLAILKQSFLTNQEQILTKKRQSLALSSKKLISSLPSLVEEVYNLDLSLAIGTFISVYDLEKPVICDKGLSFVYGKNMNITNAVPIEYYVGQTSSQISDFSSPTPVSSSVSLSQSADDTSLSANRCTQTIDRLAVLTGANSGGKTTLLELLAQIQILTQMGLFVPAKEASVGIIEELYYFSKNKGSLSAGAFETLLKQFADISDNDSSRLILADEIESVTEPSVASKIIEGIINHLSVQEKTLMVLVTHMGNELYSQSLPCRFDGIEAKGLDDELNLVVDRNPIIGRIARSTPQLIVERLSKKENNLFYTRLYESMISN